MLGPRVSLQRNSTRASSSSCDSTCPELSKRHLCASSTASPRNSDLYSHFSRQSLALGVRQRTSCALRHHLQHRYIARPLCFQAWTANRAFANIPNWQLAVTTTGLGTWPRDTHTCRQQWIQTQLRNHTSPEAFLCGARQTACL